MPYRIKLSRQFQVQKKDFLYCASPRYIFIIIYWVCCIDVACLLISEELENHTLITNDAR